MRRRAIGLSVMLAMLALIPSAAVARGPQKNDSVNGRGFVVFSPAITNDFRVSAHTISSTTTAATGNMYIKQVSTDVTGTITIEIWADVFCVDAVAINAEVRGHIYRTEPDLLFEPTDLVFNVSDLSEATSDPDLFDATTVAAGVTSCDLSLATPPVSEVAKGDISVNSEL